MNAKLQNEIEALVRDFAAQVTRLVAAAIVDEVQAALSRGTPAVPRSPRAQRARGAQAGPVERWVPDRRARRVPKFVTEATGLQAKKDIVERYGEHALFEKGQPAPPPLRAE